MALILPPVAFTLFIWWFSTGAILYLDGLPRRTYPWSLAGAGLLTAAALWLIADRSADTSVGGVYCAFLGGIVVWGWFEMAFLMGLITGPRRTPCPIDSQGWRRAGHALETILHHELGLLAAGVALAGLSWNAPNQVALSTFIVLWVMRQSAKLNVFLGVRNLSESFLPEHLRYLQTYFRRKPMNPLFPFSVTIASIVAGLIWRAALSEDAAASEATGRIFLATLMTLAVLEHWFLVLPIPADALWRWGLSSRQPPERAAAAASTTPLL
ncbi:MAG: putative photosynthetic complex assembly protein PuhE [Nevskia sp.]